MSKLRFIWIHLLLFAFSTDFYFLFQRTTVEKMNNYLVYNNRFDHTFPSNIHIFLSAKTVKTKPFNVCCKLIVQSMIDFTNQSCLCCFWNLFHWPFMVTTVGTRMSMNCATKQIEKIVNNADTMRNRYNQYGRRTLYNWNVEWNRRNMQYANVSTACWDHVGVAVCWFV